MGVALYAVTVGGVLIQPSEINRILKSNLGVVLRRANLALQGVATGDASDLGTVPGTWFRFNFGPLDQEMTKRVRADAETWVLGASFHTLLMIIGLALDRAQDGCSLALLGAKGPATRAEIQQQLEAHRKFGNLNFPDKIDRLRKDFGAELIPAFNPEIESFRRARNCLEHDHGVVTDEKYLTDGALELRWRFFELVGVSEGGEEVPLKPEPGKSGAMPGGGVAFGPGVIQVRHSAPQVKRFPRGTSISISRQEFAEICFTTQVWGDQLAQAVQAFVRKSGVTMRPADEAAGQTSPGSSA